eukprot:2234615-Pyramimonas_sp.AAC.1
MLRVGGREDLESVGLCKVQRPRLQLVVEEERPEGRVAGVGHQQPDDLALAVLDRTDARVDHLQEAAALAVQEL